jgi:Xaa-Pro dipeptidase
MDKLDRIVDTMNNLELDVLISTSSENSSYVGDIRTLSPALVQGNPVCVLISRESPRNRTIISPVGLADLLAGREYPIEDTRLYGLFHINSFAETSLTKESKELSAILGRGSSPRIYDAISDTVVERGHEKGRIAIDERNFTPLQFRTLKNKLPDAELVEAADIFRRIRMKKFSYEVERLEKAVEITEFAWSRVLETVHEDITEHDLTETYLRALISKGANPYFQVIATGERSALPNAPVSSRRIRRGDLIRLDGGCEYEGYKADIARIAVYGSPSQKHIDYYGAVLRGEEASIHQIRPGAKSSDLFKTAVETVQRSGIPHYQRHHCGHGIGLEMYDPPLVSPDDHTELEEGMVLNLETPYYELGFGGVQVEDTILVTKSGSRLLTKSSRELQVL